MTEETRFEWIRFHRLRSSSCTHVQLEKAAQTVYRSWLRIRTARRHLQRAKRNWYDDAPRPVDRARPFCFVLRRMKRAWREADRRHDLAGFAAHRTLGATRARNNWSSTLAAVIADDQMIRIRHQYHDEPALLIRESRFRALERATRDDDPLTRILGGD